jgi:two-component system response regulator
VAILGAVDILVVEDNDSQRTSIVEALEASMDGICVVAVHDGDEALNFLFARESWAYREGAEPPKLILLDLELPGANAFSILGQIRSLGPEDALMLTPVVIFTDSKSDSNATECYRCGANSYLIKPVSFTEFKTMVDMVGQYWITHNRTPVG